MDDFEGLSKKYRLFLSHGRDDEKLFLAVQKNLFKASMTLIQDKNIPYNPEADFWIGYIGATDGDRFGIPPERILNHLNRAYANGYTDAGILLSKIYSGDFLYIPSTMIKLSKSSLILEELRKQAPDNGFLKYFAVERILASVCISKTEDIDKYQASNFPEIGNDSYQKAFEAFEYEEQKGYLGHKLHLGILYFYGFGTTTKVPISYALAYKSFLAALQEVKEENLDIWTSEIYARLHFWMAISKINAKGTSLNRKEAVQHMSVSSRFGYVYARKWIADNIELFDLINADPLFLENCYYEPNTISFENSEEDEAGNVLAKKVEVKKINQNPMSFFKGFQGNVVRIHGKPKFSDYNNSEE